MYSITGHRFGIAGTIAVLVVLLTVSLAQVFDAAAQFGGQREAVKSAFEELIGSANSKSDKRRLAEVSEFYKKNRYKLLWVRNGKVTKQAKTFRQTIARAHEHALDPFDYNPLDIDIDPNPKDAKAIARFDVIFSQSLVAFAQHLNAGRLNPKTVTRENVIYPEAISAARILKEARSTKNATAYLRLLAPHTPRYERLRIALAHYRGLAQRGGWPSVPKGQALKPGMSDSRVPLIRKRLAITGDYRGNPSSASTAYSGPVVDAMKRFQKRHGLAIDGVVGGNTIKQLNIPVEARIAVMEYNLERRRWMQDDYGRYYIFANLADQVLKVVRDEKTIYAELIQVGLPYHRTPVFSDEMEYIEMNPYWNVPRSIAVNELLPKLRQNANALGPQNFEVLNAGAVVPFQSVPWGSYSKANFPVRLRQKPGTKNALGRVKFMFPNDFNVYIHDTPSKSKFSSASRFFSHGCLRLKDPLKMAEVLLGPQGWSRAKIDQTIAAKKRKVVKLSNKIPVHIAYMTAWVNKDGSVHFRRDVYGRDKILAKALAKARS